MVMPRVNHYRVFADAPHGGKHVAVAGAAEPLSETGMQQLARESGAPLTAFITGLRGHEAWVRFFTPGKEKGESDSGALVIAEYLQRFGLISDHLTVRTGAGALRVQRTPEGWGSVQEETHAGREIDPTLLLDALHLGAQALDPRYPVQACGADRHNIIVPLRDSADLDALRPDFEALRHFNEHSGTNGVIACTFSSARASDVDFRFFAPRRGLSEDNAGSYTLATLCGYLAAHRPHLREISATQGYGMHRPSRLHARFAREHQTATGIVVSGAVQQGAKTVPQEVLA